MNARLIPGAEAGAGEFSLVQYAAEAETRSPIPTYDQLRANNWPVFEQHLYGLREQLLAENESGKEVHITIGTGGTFQQAKNEQGVYEPTGTLKESFDALQLPKEDRLHIELIDLMNLDSSQMRVEHWRFLAEAIIRIEELMPDAYDGIIITHGTDTMADGAAWLSYMLQGFEKSIVMTGSQHPAREENTDARDQMDRAITTSRMAAKNGIAEVMVAAGLRTTRGAWAAKLGDKTTNAFGPWNQPHQGADEQDWKDAIKAEREYRLAPALIDFSTGKSIGDLKFASHARKRDSLPAFDPFTRVTEQGNIVPAVISGRSPTRFARFLGGQTVGVLIQLGAATGNDIIIDVAREAAERGKLIVYRAPFPDSVVPPGTYAAGAAVGTKIDRIKRPLPIVNMSMLSLETKIQFALAKLGLQPEDESFGDMGEIFSPADTRRFYDYMDANPIRERVDRAR